MWIGYFYLEFFPPQCAMLFSSLYHAWTLARKSICMLLDSTDKVNSVFSFLQLMDNDKMTQTGEQFKKGNWKLNFVYDASWKVGMKWSQVKSLSHVRLFATPWRVTYKALRSMGFSRQDYWSGLPFPSPGDLPNPGIEPGSPALQTDALPSEPYCFLH